MLARSDSENDTGYMATEEAVDLAKLKTCMPGPMPTMTDDNATPWLIRTRKKPLIKPLHIIERKNLPKTRNYRKSKRKSCSTPEKIEAKAARVNPPTTKTATLNLRARKLILSHLKLEPAKGKKSRLSNSKGRNHEKIFKNQSRLHTDRWGKSSLPQRDLKRQLDFTPHNAMGIVSSKVGRWKKIGEGVTTFSSTRTKFNYNWRVSNRDVLTRTMFSYHSDLNERDLFSAPRILERKVVNRWMKNDEVSSKPKTNNKRRKTRRRATFNSLEINSFRANGSSTLRRRWRSTSRSNSSETSQRSSRTSEKGSSTCNTVGSQSSSPKAKKRKLRSLSISPARQGSTNISSSSPRPLRTEDIGMPQKGEWTSSSLETRSSPKSSSEFQTSSLPWSSDEDDFKSNSEEENKGGSKQTARNITADSQGINQERGGQITRELEAESTQSEYEPLSTKSLNCKKKKLREKLTETTPVKTKANKNGEQNQSAESSSPLHENQNQFFHSQHHLVDQKVMEKSEGTLNSPNSFSQSEVTQLMNILLRKKKKSKNRKIMVTPKKVTQLGEVNKFQIENKTHLKAGLNVKIDDHEAGGKILKQKEKAVGVVEMCSAREQSPKTPPPPPEIESHPHSVESKEKDLDLKTKRETHRSAQKTTLQGNIQQDFDNSRPKETEKKLGETSYQRERNLPQSNLPNCDVQSKKYLQVDRNQLQSPPPLRKPPKFGVLITD